ncbi:MAG: ABC transporter permease subunit [Pseudomonadota bacterium]
MKPAGLSSEKTFWARIALVCILIFVFVEAVPAIGSYPEAWVLPLADGITAVMTVFVDTFRWLFRAVAWLLDWPLVGIRTALLAVPWILIVGLFMLLAYRAGGRSLAVFTGLALLYMVVVGYWTESMNTLALIAVSVPMSAAMGLALGIAAYRSEATNRIVQPVLDLMQTIPAFAYLIPILFLFGFGPAVGLVASAIFATPPTVRNTILGLRQVPQSIRDSAAMSGCTARQRFWMVEIPTATPQIMVGLNQTIMAALSMVIIAAIIGGFDDIGWEVLSTMRKAQFGQSLLAGLVIALLAIVLDRISAGMAKTWQRSDPPDIRRARRRGFALAALAIIVGSIVLAALVPAFGTWPRAWEVYPAAALNDAVSYIVKNYHQVLTGLKNTVLFYFMLPLRIGFSQAISPFTWGIELTDGMIAGYATLCAALTAWFAYRNRWGLAASVVVLGTLLFYGTTGLPWPVVIIAVTALAYRVGGWQTGLFAFASLAFMAVNGLWQPVMLSVYLCGIAVLISFLAGGALGIWAAENDTVSRILRPINDTLQTMPQFVLLIPALMLFKVGEFTALIAIIAYAIVPPIRYFEHGLRSVPAQTVEAARQIGCSPMQILFEVKLPLALPIIMLGLNQTILYGLSMLVIAALVGTQGLGQQVYLALGNADMGMGVVAGLSMALVAMVADRILQAVSARQQEKLGTAPGSAPPGG